MRSCPLVGAYRFTDCSDTSSWFLPQGGSLCRDPWFGLRRPSRLGSRRLPQSAAVPLRSRHLRRQGRSGGLVIVRTRTSASSHRNAPSTRLDQIPRGSPLRSASSMSESRNSTRSGELRELTYPNDFTASGFASLSDGSYREVAAPGSAAFLDVRLQRSAFGARNGAPAAAVVLATAGGGSGTFFDLHVIVRDGDGAPTIAAQRGRVTFGRTVGPSAEKRSPNCSTPAILSRRWACAIGRCC